MGMALALWNEWPDSEAVTLPLFDHSAISARRFSRVSKSEPNGGTDFSRRHPQGASSLLFLRLCIEKVVHHRDDDVHALHQRDVRRVGQDGQS